MERLTGLNISILIGESMDKEKNVWKDSNHIDEALSNFINGRPEYPAICPDCNNKTAHIYINRDGDRDRGGAWAWCSTCHAFGHYSFARIPKWWNNWSNIDSSKLCGACPPCELIGKEDVWDDDLNYLLRTNCMFDNACQYCVRKEYEHPAKCIFKCEECGNDSMMAELDGLCLVITCSKCGAQIVGASFWPACMEDNLEYTIAVSEIPKEKKVRVAKLYGINVMDLLNSMRETGMVQKIFCLEEAKDMIEELQALELDYSISPDLRVKYPELIGCKYR